MDRNRWPVSSGLGGRYHRNRHTFKVLTESKVIGKNLCRTLENMAKFRNIVVHQYETIDPVIVVSILNRNLRDFEKYKKAIIKYLSSQETRE
jgi:uncharacterized protein YutE (UPF0331/DUF86 family)